MYVCVYMYICGMSMMIYIYNHYVSFKITIIYIHIIVFLICLYVHLSFTPYKCICICVDYYDIVTSPMDLETVRMKVDEDAYPTLGQFLIIRVHLFTYIVHTLHATYVYMLQCISRILYISKYKYCCI